MKLSKGRPNTPPTSCSVVTDPQLLCEVICDRTLNQMLLQRISNHTGLHACYNKLNQRLWSFGVL
jgi:hypothetical protein